MARRLVAAVLLPMLVVGLAGLLGACTTDDPGRPSKSDPSGDVALRVESVRVRGVDERTRTRLESEIGDLLAAYVVAGYLGDRPRDDYVRSLTDFSGGVADDAGPDLDGLTLAGLSGVQSVRATRLHATLAYFNPGGQTVGASAFLDLTFELTMADGTTRQVVRTGRVSLGRRDGAWQVQGYRLCCIEADPVTGEVS